MQNNLLFLIPFLLVISCNSDKPSEQLEEDSSVISGVIDTANATIIDPIDTSSAVVDDDNNYTSETFFTEGQGWGYSILLNGDQYINQPHIPAVSGVKGFESEDKAKKTADFAIYKMQNGIVPPTISTEELDSLEVL